MDGGPTNNSIAQNIRSLDYTNEALTDGDITVSNPHSLNRHGVNGNRKKRIPMANFEGQNTVIHDPDMVNFSNAENEFMKSIEQCGDFVPLPPPKSAFSKKVSSQSGANT